MKKRNIGITLISFLLLSAIVLNCWGCSSPEGENLMEDIVPNRQHIETVLSEDNVAVTDFAVRLLQETNKKGQNILISPLSVFCALSLTANGADVETLKQMEKVLGLTTEQLNSYVYAYVNGLPQGEKYKVHLANSIWFVDDPKFSVNKSFLQTNADYHGADVYKVPFDDSTVNDINRWVNENTDGMIPKMISEIPDEAIMYLVNTLAFDAVWQYEYTKRDVRKGTFIKEDGTVQNAEFMYSQESVFLKDEYATGFKKNYKDGKYAFVAMLPNENVSVYDYIEYLDGEQLHALLSNPQNVQVNASLPKFETEYAVEMSETLLNMGMKNAFDQGKADFGNLGTVENGNIYIESIEHKACISVGEQGTKAGASTVVVALNGIPSETEDVYLNRPFVYMIIDCENNIPLFIGTMMDIDG